MNRLQLDGAGLEAPAVGTETPQSKRQWPSVFLNDEQRTSIARVLWQGLKQGKDGNELENDVRDVLRELPEGLLARNGWQVDELAVLCTLAGLLAGVVYQKRGLLP